MKFLKQLSLCGWMTLCVLTTPAWALTEVAGVKLEPSIKLADTELKLNGAGIRYKAIFKVYVAALYLKEKKTSVAEILAADGPRRVSITMLREVNNEDFGRGFMNGIQQNTDKSEKLRLTNQFLRFGELFASVPEVKKGDVMVCDYLPGTGTIVYLNGKKLGEPYPDLAFFNAILRIWLGEKPADSGLKRAWLGEEDGRATR